MDDLEHQLFILRPKAGDVLIVYVNTPEREKAFARDWAHHSPKHPGVTLVVLGSGERMEKLSRERVGHVLSQIVGQDLGAAIIKAGKALR